jgi:hypothetical protein
MCRVDMLDERASVWNETYRKARKDYRCGECGRGIAAGERYVYLWAIGTDGPFTARWCLQCDVAKEWLWQNCGGSIITEVAEDIEEHVQEYERMDLARLAVGMRRKWRRFKAPGLIPPMSLPKPIAVGEHR